MEARITLTLFLLVIWFMLFMVTFGFTNNPVEGRMNLLKRNLRLKINFKRNIMNTNVAIQYLMRESKSFTSEEREDLCEDCRKENNDNSYYSPFAEEAGVCSSVEWKPIS